MNQTGRIYPAEKLQNSKAGIRHAFGLPAEGILPMPDAFFRRCFPQLIDFQAIRSVPKKKSRQMIGSFSFRMDSCIQRFSLSMTAEDSFHNL